MVTPDQVRELASSLPRAYEVVVRGRVKFRVKQIVFLAFSRDMTLMGFGFPREEREFMVASRPETFLMPRESDLRFQWIVARLDALERREMEELVYDAWRMCVPRYVIADHAAAHPDAAYVRSAR
jgi:hypothetical protein